ncbi:MAG TPA: DNA-formamidopyrimidine glycosylase family protein, partial [Acidimicrobiia bacterium]|nr:DNA-formamidopyrimidine glycosylase family protein [Acidimicrobiia bacterium]
MPELPQMQALSERLQARVGGAALAGVQPIGFSGLKTFDPPPESLVGRTLERTGRRGKYLILDFGGPRIFVHLSQAGRLDVEEPPKKTRGGKGGVVRLRFDNDVALLVREHGTERKAGWWVVGEGEVGPVEGLGPEPDSDEFAELILHGDDRRRVHTML